MKKGEFWKLSVTTSQNHEEVVSGIIYQVCGIFPVSFNKEGTTEVVVSVYLPQKKTEAVDLKNQLTLRLKKKKSSPLASLEVILEYVPAEDWAESWKKHFPVLQIGRFLMIKPSWSHRSLKPGQIEIILDPGLSFGTGHHPTTHFCLQQVVDSRRKKKASSMIDMGTGSGILAIAAAKLGYGQVEALISIPLQ